MGSVTNAVYGRFFRAEPRAFARTLTFRVRKDELDELRKLYEEVIFPKIVELDARALTPNDDASADSEADAVLGAARIHQACDTRRRSGG